MEVRAGEDEDDKDKKFKSAAAIYAAGTVLRRPRSRLQAAGGRCGWEVGDESSVWGGGRGGEEGRDARPRRLLRNALNIKS